MTQQTDHILQAEGKLKDQRPKGIPEGRKRKPCLRAVLKGFASSQRTISGSPQAWCCSLHYRAPPPTLPLPPSEDEQLWAENSNSYYSLYSMSQGQCHMTSKSCVVWKAVKPKKPVYPNTASVWDEPFSFNESQVLQEVDYLVSSKPR